jgi:hypothetical protein
MNVAASRPYVAHVIARNDYAHHARKAVLTAVGRQPASSTVNPTSPVRLRRQMSSEARGPFARDYWDHVEDVFAAAVAAEDSARTAVLDARCAARVELRAEVEALLAAHARAAEFITPRTRESRLMLEKLMAENPLDTKFSTGLLFALSGEGKLLELTGEPLAALSVYQHQLEIASQRALRDPNDSTAQAGVAVALRQLGDIMLRRRRIDEARSYVEEGRAIIARFVARDPTNGWAVDTRRCHRAARRRAPAIVLRRGPCARVSRIRGSAEAQGCAQGPQCVSGVQH